MHGEKRGNKINKQYVEERGDFIICSQKDSEE